MNESYSNELDVVLVNDPNCLQRQYTCQRRWWNGLTQRAVYSGPSLLARIFYRGKPSAVIRPQDDGVLSQEEVLAKGHQLIYDRVTQFRTSVVGGCRDCLVRKFDAEQCEANNYRGTSTCGNIVDLNAQILDMKEIESDSTQMVCVTVRLTGPKTSIGPVDKERIKLLSQANCFKLVEFGPLTSGKGSPTMPIYEQTIEGE